MAKPDIFKSFVEAPNGIVIGYMVQDGKTDVVTFAQLGDASRFHISRIDQVDPSELELNENVPAGFFPAFIGSGVKLPLNQVQALDPKKTKGNKKPDSYGKAADQAMKDFKKATAQAETDAAAV